MFMQWLAGCLAMLAAMPFLYGTPLHDGLVYGAIWGGGAYAMALWQFHRRFSRRGAATTAPGASISGRSPAL